MSSSRDAEQRRIARRLNDELARIRTAELQAEYALQEIQAARRRVEKLVASLEPAEAPEASDRERLSGPAGLPWRGGPERAVEEEPSPPPSAAARTRRAAQAQPEGVEGTPGAGRGRRLILAGVAAAVAVLLVGWLVLLGIRGSLPANPLVLSGDPEAPAEPPDDTPVDVPIADPAEDDDAVDPAAGIGLASLPEAPEARTVLYDSLFAARSAFFAPLLDSVAAVTGQRQVSRAVAAWKDDGDLSAKESDVIQSALVQWILMREIDQRVSVDGELLRNPCRGRSCSALLNYWQMGRERFGFPEIPDDAPTNGAALHTVEAMLVLDRMKALADAGAGAESGGR